MMRFRVCRAGSSKIRHVAAKLGDTVVKGFNIFLFRVEGSGRPSTIVHHEWRLPSQSGGGRHIMM